MDSLVKPGSTTRALLSGMGSFVLPGIGQALNGKIDQALGMATVWSGATLVWYLGVPGLAPIAWVVAGATMFYSAVDAYRTVRKQR